MPGQQGSDGPQGPAGPQGPTPPVLVGPAYSEGYVLLQIPGLTPQVPSGLSGHGQEFELSGFSGYELTTAGATPILVIRRPSNVDSPYFLGKVVDQHPLSTTGDVTITTLNPAGNAVVQTLRLQGVTVDSVATGWVYDVVVLRYTSMTEKYPDNTVTAAITPNVNDSVAPDYGPAAATDDCGGCYGIFHGAANGQSNLSGYTDWNEASGWMLLFTHTSSGTRIQAQMSLVPNASTSLVVKAQAAQTTQNRYDLRVLVNGQQQMTPVQFACTSANLGRVRRWNDNSMQLNATVSGCTGTWQRFTPQGTPQGQPVTFTSP